MKSTFVVAVGAPPDSLSGARLIGKTLPRARREIRRAHCSVGRISRARSVRPRGRIVRQSPRAGRRLVRGSRINLVVSLGPG